MVIDHRRQGRFPVAFRRNVHQRKRHRRDRSGRYLYCTRSDRLLDRPLRRQRSVRQDRVEGLHEWNTEISGVGDHRLGQAFSTAEYLRSRSFGPMVRRAEPTIRIRILGRVSTKMSTIPLRCCPIDIKTKTRSSVLGSKTNRTENVLYDY